MWIKEIHEETMERYERHQDGIRMAATGKNFRIRQFTFHRGLGIY
jgi:hypothetical protein